MTYDDVTDIKDVMMWEVCQQFIKLLYMYFFIFKYPPVVAGTEYWIFTTSLYFECFYLYPHQYVACHTTAIVEIYSEDQSSSALTDYKEVLQQHRAYLTLLKLLPSTRLVEERCAKKIHFAKIGRRDWFDGIKNVFLSREDEKISKIL